jgi:hypothetical protein
MKEGYCQQIVPTDRHSREGGNRFPAVERWVKPAVLLTARLEKLEVTG